MLFRTNMARFLIPKIEGKPTHGDSKWHQTSDRFLDWFFIDLASVLGATLEPRWPPFSTQNGPGRFQDASKSLPRRSKTLPQTSKIRQDCPRRLQTCPRALQTSMLVPPGLDFDGAFWQNADPFWDGFGILTMQIPSRLHVIEVPKVFSKIKCLKELPVCSTIRGQKGAEFVFSFQLKNLSSIPCLREPAEQANTPLYVPAMARGLPKPLKEKSLKYIWSAFRPFVQV